MEHGVPEDRIISSTWCVRSNSIVSRALMWGWGRLSAPEGLKSFTAANRRLRVVASLSQLPCFALIRRYLFSTGWIDDGLNERAFIVPGLGDFGERGALIPGMDGGYADFLFQVCA